MKKVLLVLMVLAFTLFTFADDITVKQTLGANVLPVINTATWTGTGWITQPGYSTHSTWTTALYPSTNPIKTGVKYLLEYTISNISTGTITASCGGVSDSARSTNGNFSVVITTTAETVLAFTPTNTCDGTVSNVSLRPYEGGNIRAYGNITSEGNTTVKGALAVTGATTISGALTVSGALNDPVVLSGASIVFEGATADAYETTLTVTDPTADNVVTLPNATGTVCLSTLNILADGTSAPVNAVASQGTITMSGIATAEETFVVDTQTFTWKAARAGAGEVTIGADAPAAVTNIVTAITADLATVTAADGTGDTVVITAATKGVAGNSIVLTENATNMAVDGTGTLGATTTGVDGTVGTAREIRASASYLYYCTATNTIADANWRRVSLGTVY